jgi:hypothetical protein
MRAGSNGDHRKGQGMNSTQRVLRYKHRQQQAGCKAVVLYLLPATIKQLKTLAGNKQRGTIVDSAIGEYVVNNTIGSNKTDAG